MLEAELSSRSVEITDPGRAAAAFSRAFDLLLSKAEQEGSTGLNRQVAGAFFTPPLLIEPILEHALLPTILGCVRARAFPEVVDELPPISEWSAAEKLHAIEALEAIRVCDPACGPATFLLPAADKLLTNELAARFSDTPLDTLALRDLRANIVKRSIHGVELHPVIARGARVALWIWADRPREGAESLGRNIRLGDSIAQAPTGSDPLPPEMLFDVVIGNPPFANAIESKMESAIRAVKEDRRDVFAELSGTADLSYYFLALADRITKPEGAVGFVLPRALLNARSARKLRERLTRTRPPALIFAPPDPLLFRDANVSVVALVLRRGSSCWASRDIPEEGNLPRFRIVTVASENWWSPLDEIAARLEFTSTTRLEDRFEIWGSMTAGMAYDLAPFVQEEDQAPTLRPSDPPLWKLVTTGLIDPQQCLWGSRVCRYLKQRFQKPVIDPRRELPASVRNRLTMMRRPKVIVAGLSNRVEAFVDREGSYCGAVSTYTILDPQDDLLRLEELSAYLATPAVTEQLRQELGATALSGGRITLTKEFLRRLYLP